MNHFFPISPAALLESFDQGDKLWAYAGFVALVIAFLVLDLTVLHREAHEVKMKEALRWSAFWLSLGLAFSVFVYFAYDNHWLGLGLQTAKYNAQEAVAAGGALIVSGEVLGLEAAKQYLVGYVIEKSLAMDNIFVIALIFAFFAVPAKYQHRVLFWGILGALLMRGGMIFLGSGLILKYQWILILFGGFLLLTALKMALIKGNDDVSQNVIVKLAKRLFRTVEFYDGERFFTRRSLKPTYSRDAATGKEVMDPAPAGSLSAKWAITPLFLALLMVEVTDLVFAVDSIPAIFAITPDPFIVFTSNIFAILGLRALYFCLAVLITRFRFLKPALILILAFVGVKLLLMSVPPYLAVVGAQSGAPIKIDTLVSLLVVLGTLATATVLSILVPQKTASRPG
ncbi:MAG: TerC/Alx family metal homeostasis membrane protein [Planctomycetota bacterium]|nr:TerC/Alx family metal homeostasis membrane protein [Planctomycetota bacterium]